MSDPWDDPQARRWVSHVRDEVLADDLEQQHRDLDSPQEASLT